MNKKRNLTIGETISCDPDDKYGESRIVTIVQERHPFETFLDQEELVLNSLYSHIYSDYDCTGQWFTMRHNLYKIPDYWVIKLYERVDL